VDLSAVPAAWRADGFSCDIWTDPPGQVWADFVHTTDERVMLIEGEIELSFSGVAQRPAIGELVLIPARTPHTVRNVGRGRNRWYYGYLKT